MKNISLAEDYIVRAGHRIEAVALLLERKSYADVVRESQEVVELCLKSLLRMARIEIPRIHDVSDILKNEADKLPAMVRPHLDRMTRISRQLRRDRELSFYGSEDLTPSEFYQEEDARTAFEDAQYIQKVCRETFDAS